MRDGQKIWLLPSGGEEGQQPGDAENPWKATKVSRLWSMRKAAAHEEGCLLSSAAFLKWMSGAESSIIPIAPGPQNLRLIATGGYSTCISFCSISLQSLFLWLSKPIYWASQVTSGKEFACQCRRCRFNPWVQKIHWRRKWQPTPVFLAGAFHGQRSLVGYSPCGT